MKKAGLILVAACFMVFTVYTAHARYAYIAFFYTDGTISATSVSGKATVELESPMDSKTVLTLEKSIDGGSTYTYDSVLASKTSRSIGYSTTGSKSGLSDRYTYRIKAEIFVYDSDGVRELDYDYNYIE